MKMKMVTALFVLSLGTTASFAQTGASDGSRFGHGEDSIRCLKNISIYTEYVKTNNFKDAYTPWMSVFNILSVNTDIFHRLLRHEEFLHH